MNPVKKIILASVIIIAVSFVVLQTNAWNLMGKPIDLTMTENAVVQKVSFDSSDNTTVLLDVQSQCSKDIVFNTVIVKDSRQGTVATIAPFQATLPANQKATITVDLSSLQLGSGNYTLDQWTSKSHVIYSPTFTWPPK
jgi:hypothetical protein